MPRCGRSLPPSAASGPLLVLLHGYGADERDLFGLAPYLPPEYVVASVRAPLTPPFPAPGYSWYPIEGLDGRDPVHVTDAASLRAGLARRRRTRCRRRAAGLLAGRRGGPAGAAAAPGAVRVRGEPQRAT